MYVSTTLWLSAKRVNEKMKLVIYLVYTYKVRVKKVINTIMSCILDSLECMPNLRNQEITQYMYCNSICIKQVGDAFHFNIVLQNPQSWYQGLAVIVLSISGLWEGSCWRGWDICEGIYYPVSPNNSSTLISHSTNALGSFKSECVSGWKLTCKCVGVQNCTRMT